MQKTSQTQCRRTQSPTKSLFRWKKDSTLVIENVNQKHFRRTIQEEHYSVIQEHGSGYIDHVTSSSGIAKNCK